MSVFAFSPNELPGFKQKMLAVFSALLCGLFAFFFVGSLRVTLNIRNKWARLGIQSSGGAAAFVLILMWWNNQDIAPVKQASNRQEVINNGSSTIVNGPVGTITNNVGFPVDQLPVLLEKIEKVRPDSSLKTGKLEISDIVVDDYREDFTAVVDFRLINRGDRPLSISRVRFDVVETMEVPTAGFLDFSAKYNLDISDLKKVGDHAEVIVSQALQPGEVDRMAVILTAKNLGVGIFRLWKLRPAFSTSDGEVRVEPIAVGLPWNIARSMVLPGTITPRGDVYYSCEPIGKLTISNNGDLSLDSHVEDNFQAANATFSFASGPVVQVVFLPSGSDYLTGYSSDVNKRAVDIESINITFRNESATCKRVSGE